MMKKVVITGGAGFIGSKITESLIEKGYSVTVLDIFPPKTEKPNLSFVKVDTSLEMDPKIFEGVYGVINLAGVNIGQRWNKKIKTSIKDSRINTTINLVSAISKTNVKPSTLISASAVGIYGDQKDVLLEEGSSYGRDFLAQVAKSWEEEASKARDLGTRVCLVRTAHVLGKGGILGALTPVFKKHLGGYFGNGKQYMPWVHWQDIVNIYVFLLEKDYARGSYNTGAGEPITQKKLFKTFAKVNKFWPVWMIPRPIAKIVLGEFGLSLFSSQKISSEKLISLGFSFKYTNVSEAIKNI
ncbi:MAG: TIGR01777 family oxidoreductase [Candidatus Paceibacterota bacterium]